MKMYFGDNYVDLVKKTSRLDGNEYFLHVSYILQNERCNKNYEMKKNTFILPVTHRLPSPLPNVQE